MDAVRLALVDNVYGSVTYVDYLARALAAQILLRKSAAGINPISQLGQIGEVGPVIAQAIEYMRANIDVAISLDDIAQAVGRSSSHLARQFRASLGVPPHQFLLVLRIKHAQHLLTSTGDPIAEIAFACGFSHQEHLTRMFRRWCQTTPAAYRRASRN